MFNLSIILGDSARRNPSKDAFIFGDTRLTYAQVDRMASQVANALQGMDIQPGDKVALSCPNLPFFPIIYYGILRLGAIVVPLSILLKRDEVKYHLKDSESIFYFCFEGSDTLPMGVEGYEGFKQVDSCREFITITVGPDGDSPFEGSKTLGAIMDGQGTAFDYYPASAEETAVILYTSGTTGRPKGAELSHSNLAWNADLCRHLFQFNSDDRILIVLPLFHIFGQTCLMNAGVMHCLSNVLLVRFDAQQVLDAILKERISLFAGVPTMYWGLLNHRLGEPDDIVGQVRRHLRTCVSGGASLPVQVLTDFERRFEVEIYEGYGMSEGSPVVTFNQPGQVRKPGSIGTAVWGVDVKLVDPQGNEVEAGEKGELLYKGHNVMKGYYNKPEATAEVLRDGWLYSGDIAVRDEDGYFYIVDRTKDMIIRGGLNVYPREIEEVMMNHSSVSMVAVIGVPNEKFGEEIKAYVVLKDGEDIGTEDLVGFVKEKVAAYKYPRIVEIVDALPTSATGKILKRELRST